MGDIPAAIVVAVEPAPVAPVLEGALVRACSDAARPRECVVQRDGRARADATVTWSRDTATIRAESGTGAGTARTLEFREEDGATDRWNAVGLVVAALVDASPAAAPPASAPARHPRFWLGTGALVGRGLADGPPRVGGWLRVSVRPGGLPVFLLAEVAPAVAAGGPEGVRPSFLPLSLGLGGAFLVEPWRLALRPSVAGFVVRQGLSREGPPRDSGARWMDGLRLGLDVSFPATAPVALVGTLSGERLSGATGVRVGGEKVTSFPADAFTVGLGVELAVLP